MARDGLVEHGLEPVPVRVAHERGEVSGVVMPADPRRTVVRASVCDRGGVERVDLFTGARGQREVEGRIGAVHARVASHERERRLAAEPRRTVPHRARRAKETDEPERRERRVVERGRAIEIHDTEGDVVEHEAEA